MALYKCFTDLLSYHLQSLCIDRSLLSVIKIGSSVVVLIPIADFPVDPP